MFRNLRGRRSAQVANNKLVYPGAVDRMNNLDLVNARAINRMYHHELIFPRMIEHLGGPDRGVLLRDIRGDKTS